MSFLSASVPRRSFSYALEATLQLIRRHSWLMTFWMPSAEVSGTPSFPRSLALTCTAWRGAPSKSSVASDRPEPRLCRRFLWDSPELLLADMFSLCRAASPTRDGIVVLSDDLRLPSGLATVPGAARALSMESYVPPMPRGTWYEDLLLPRLTVGGTHRFGGGTHTFGLLSLLGPPSDICEYALISTCRPASSTNPESANMDAGWLKAGAPTAATGERAAGEPGAASCSLLAPGRRGAVPPSSMSSTWTTRV
mmetsp:Transcript_69689/g.179648  ORF Transcript_69689/g.179648 Transcript_69689/m.179648 type:complete len:252 (-) Transcript_69689:60-815(-)